ncbi:RagB/SusD family nutrient uptake outer membrane protein [Compostibacter hankyongensis]|uniref:RagB/SusD family nutrient uptake outer membrane protein n=1 Tax=Compostibacter hankyongensis TaxID=1007089 RepID=A0ABP8FKB1_9BACT
MKPSLIRYFIFPAFILLFVIQEGCRKTGSFLDQKVGASLNEDIVFSDSAYTMDNLADIYEGLYFWYNTNTPNSSNGPWDEMTDEAETRWPGGHNIPNQVFEGTFGTEFYNYIQSDWTHFYTRIRQCNIFLQNVDRSPLSGVLKERTKAEARFLRAYHYFLLMEGFGGVPIVGDTVYGLASLNVQVRSSWEDCVNYVVSELDDIAPQLPVRYSGLDYGRITRGACLALKSRLLLFAASPLYNGGSPAEDGNLKPLTGYPTYDASRWQKALKAAQDVVSLGAYHLETDNDTKPGYGFYHMFLQRVSDEIILARMQGPNKDIEQHEQPKSRGGDYRRYPTQELVDAFPMKNGRAIGDNASGYDQDNPYDNRDPRFYYTVVYNGASLMNKTSNQMEPVWTYKGAPQDGLQPVTSNTATNTGYYVRKMMDDQVTANGTARTDRCAPILFRYAEVLLNLAEAANETGNTDLALQQLIALRKRAGIDPGGDNRYGLPAAPSKDEARELIRNERFIELAFEMQRFWDLKRWKAGDWLDGQMMHGMQVTKNDDGSFSYKRIETRHRYFGNLIYYFPIPLDEVSVNPALLQNPGW